MSQQLEEAHACETRLLGWRFVCGEGGSEEPAEQTAFGNFRLEEAVEGQVEEQEVLRQAVAAHDGVGEKLVDGVWRFS